MVFFICNIGPVFINKTCIVARIDIPLGGGHHVSVDVVLFVLCQSLIHYAINSIKRIQPVNMRCISICFTRADMRRLLRQCQAKCLQFTDNPFGRIFSLSDMYTLVRTPMLCHVILRILRYIQLGKPLSVAGGQAPELFCYPNKSDEK